MTSLTVQSALLRKTLRRWHAGRCFRTYTAIAIYPACRGGLPYAVDRTFQLLDVEPRDTLAHGAQQIRGDRPDAARHAICRQHLLAVRPVDRGHVADLRAVDLRNINHGHVHGDDADDWRELPAQQHVPAISQRAVDSVSVPRRENADA